MPLQLPVWGLLSMRTTSLLPGQPPGSMRLSIIKKAQNYLSLLYSRYCQHLVGPVKSLESRMNQHFILAQLEKCELVYSMENLHLDDLSDSKGLDVQAVGQYHL